MVMIIYILLLTIALILIPFSKKMSLSEKIVSSLGILLVFIIIQINSTAFFMLAFIYSLILAPAAINFFDWYTTRDLNK